MRSYCFKSNATAIFTSIVAVSTTTPYYNATSGIALFVLPAVMMAGTTQAFHTMTQSGGFHDHHHQSHQSHHQHVMIQNDSRMAPKVTSSSSTRLFASAKKPTKKKSNKKSLRKKINESYDSVSDESEKSVDDDGGGESSATTPFETPFATTYHAPVMWRECIQALLDGRKLEQQNVGMTPCIFIDGTLGGGGHCQALLESLGPGDVVFGCDRDIDALETASQRLLKYTLPENAKSLPLFIPVQSNFAHLTRDLLLQHYDKARSDNEKDLQIQKRLANVKNDGVDGILLDLGVSSYQIDTAERGFAFMQDGPLDMRMGKSNDGTLTAADICNEFDSRELQRIFQVYGDEPRSKTIAVSIVKHRPLRTTSDLQNAVAAVTPEYSRTRRLGRTATLARVFQSLRIVVNQEDVMLELALTKMAPSILRPGGRLAVLSYQSMEDRITKRVMRDGTISTIEAHQNDRNQRDIYGRYVGAPKPFRPIGKKVKASAEEVESNVRSRSATLRVAEKQETLLTKEKIYHK